MTSKEMLYFFLLRSIFVLTNSADPDKTPHDVAFHQGFRLFAKLQTDRQTNTFI